MDIEVDVQDAQAIPPRPGDRQRRVVVDAEAGGPVGHRVVEAAARMEGMVDVAAQDRLDRPERATGDGGTGLVHPAEGRIVAPDPDPGRARPERIAREPLHGGDVVGGVAPAQLVVRGGLGRQAGRRSDGPKQLHRRPEPARRQRVIGPEVVVRRPRAVDEQHGGHDTVGGCRGRSVVGYRAQRTLGADAYQRHQPHRRRRWRGRPADRVMPLISIKPGSDRAMVPTDLCGRGLTCWATIRACPTSSWSWSSS